MKRTLTARWVLPMDGPPLAGGAVSIDDGLIVAVGDRRSTPFRVEDLGDAVLLPGLVNAHTHLEFNGVRQPLGRPGIELAEWIRLVIAERHRGARDLSANILAGLRESLVCGVTAVGETATSLVNFEVPLNCVVFQEVIGFSPGRIDSAFAELRDRLDKSRDLADRQPASRSLAAQGISPHAPYTVHPQLLERLVNEAERQQLPVAMHLAESRAELQLLSEGTGPFRELLEDRSMWDANTIPRGATPLDYLRCLARAPRTLVIHGNYLSPQEIWFLAQNRERMSVVFCPRTHSYFGHSRFPLREMIEAGARVALGTDGRSSNPDLSVLSEVRAVAEQYGLPPLVALRLGTLNGAEALGWGRLLGSITPGKRADLVAVPCHHEHPADAVLVHEGPPTSVWIGGERVTFPDTF